MRDLDEPHAPFGEPPGQEALAAEVGGDGIIQAIGPQRAGGLVGEGLYLRDRGLHAEGQLEGVPAPLSAAPGFDSSAWLPGDVMARFFQDDKYQGKKSDIYRGK